MTVSSFLQILLVVAAIAGGQVLFKIAATSTAGLLGLAVSPAMIAALAIYAAGTLLWVHVLKTVPLSFAYPLMSLTLAIVPLVGALCFGEVLGLRQIMGIGVILVGVVIVYA
jgi:small multidrug resistance pump